MHILEGRLWKPSAPLANLERKEKEKRRERSAKERREGCKRMGRMETRKKVRKTGEEWRRTTEL